MLNILLAGMCLGRVPLQREHRPTGACAQRESSTGNAHFNNYENRPLRYPVRLTTAGALSSPG
jgi:hypothetical protein